MSGGVGGVGGGSNVGDYQPPQDPKINDYLSKLNSLSMNDLTKHTDTRDPDYGEYNGMRNDARTYCDWLYNHKDELTPDQKAKANDLFRQVGDHRYIY